MLFQILESATNISEIQILQKCKKPKNDNFLARNPVIWWEAVQKVLAENKSWVENVTQQMKGSGTQAAETKNESVINGVKQQQF